MNQNTDGDGDHVRVHAWLEDAVRPRSRWTGSTGDAPAVPHWFPTLPRVPVTG